MEKVIKKLQIKELHKRGIVWNAPEELSNLVTSLNQIMEVDRGMAAEQGLYDFILVFVKSEEEISGAVKKVFPIWNKAGLLWFAYPKKSSEKYDVTISRDHGWESLANYSLQGVRQVAIDGDWSALRFRPTEQIKK